MSTEAVHQGQAAAAGTPTIGSSATATTAAPIEISTVVASGSSPRLMVAFQPAWQAAANRTAAKTKDSIKRGSVISDRKERRRVLMTEFQSPTTDPDRPHRARPWERRAG